MRQILRVVLTKEYIFKAILIIIVSLILAYLSRENICRMLYMLAFGGWGLTYIYVKKTIDDENDDL